jgi:hypothetical protein
LLLDRLLFEMKAHAGTRLDIEELDGDCVGICDGSLEGILDGSMDGDCNGILDGSLEGIVEGSLVGDCDNILDGGCECIRSIEGQQMTNNNKPMLTTNKQGLVSSSVCLASSRWGCQTMDLFRNRRR